MRTMKKIDEVLTKRELEMKRQVENGNYRCRHPAGSASSTCKKAITTCDTCGEPVCRACARLKLTDKKNTLSIHHNWCLPKKEQRHITIGDDF